MEAAKQLAEHVAELLEAGRIDIQDEAPILWGHIEEIRAANEQSDVGDGSLLDAYAQACVDSMDMDAALEIAKEKIEDNCKDLTQEELIDEIMEWHPHILNLFYRCHICNDIVRDCNVRYHLREHNPNAENIDNPFEYFTCLEEE